ncbi:MAB_1171c family putative transporter [Kitasatospora sp. NPDC048538]|uniref:MAB_1171c family putative transporter n=1 Tax=unclassified Kitasatospora TaxID=2633591 RepID=UPI00340BD2F5
MEELLMRPLFTWLMPTLAWSVVLWRTPSAFTTRANRSIWAGFAAIAAGLSVRPAAVERALAELSGVRDITLLVKHLAGVVAGYFMLEYVQAVRGRPQRPGAARARMLFTGAAAVALTLLFLLALPHDHDGAFGIDAHYGDPGVELYLGVFDTVFAVAAAQAAVLFWSNRASVPPGAMRAGVTCLAAASATGLVYTVYRVYFVLSSGDSTRLDADGKPVPLTDTVSELLPALMIVLFVLGVTIPPTRSLAGYLRDQYALWRLHPLWADVTTAVPQVVLGTPGSRLRGLLTPGDRSVELAHRAFALRDAALVLREDSPVTGGSPATGTAGGAGGGPAVDTRAAAGADVHLDAGEGLARVEARWLRTAVRHRARGLAAPAPPAVLDATAGGRSLPEEIAWVLAVADAYRELGRSGAEA